MASLLFRGKIPRIWDLISLVANVVQSSLFLGCNAGGYVTFICAIRRLLGGHNWYSLGFLSSWPASLAAIFLERPSRRGALSIYVCYIATEAIIETYRSSGMLPNIPGFNSICFGVLSSILIYVLRKKQSAKPIQTSKDETKKKSEGKDVVFSLLSIILGKEECEERSLKESKQGLNLPSIKYIFKGFAYPFLGGTAITIALNLFRAIMRKPSLMKVIFTLIQRHNFDLALFLGTYGGVFKLISCLLRGALKTNQVESVAAPAGFLAGLSSMALFRSPSITIYTAWKTIDILLKAGVASGRLPVIPFCTEIGYATATAVLFHFGVTEPESLKPSYFGFLNRITENRMSHLNRYLIDYEYGGIASRVHGFVPKYGNEDVFGERMKRVWPKIVQERVLVVQNK